MGPLQELGRKVYDNAVAHGFYEKGAQDAFVPERLMLMVSEISEALEEWRNGHGVTEVYYKDGKPEGLPVEIADTVIRILDFCVAYHIDIDEAVKIKMEYNASRPYRHGGKKA